MQPFWKMETFSDFAIYKKIEPIRTVYALASFLEDKQHGRQSASPPFSLIYIDCRCAFCFKWTFSCLQECPQRLKTVGKAHVGHFFQVAVQLSMKTCKDNLMLLGRAPGRSVVHRDTHKDRRRTGGRAQCGYCFR